MNLHGVDAWITCKHPRSKLWLREVVERSTPLSTLSIPHAPLVHLSSAPSAPAEPPPPPPDPVVHQLIPLPLLASASSLTFCTRAGVQFCKNLFNFDPQV